MNLAHSFFDSSLSHRTESPDCMVADAQPVCRNPAPSNDVGQERLSHIRHSITAAEREAAIERAEALAAHYDAKYENTGDFAAKGDADRARWLRDLLIAGRREGRIA